jgi:hypothetical protein
MMREEPEGEEEAGALWVVAVRSTSRWDVVGEQRARERTRVSPSGGGQTASTAARAGALQAAGTCDGGRNAAATAAAVAAAAAAIASCMMRAGTAGGSAGTTTVPEVRERLTPNSGWNIQNTTERED